MRELAVRWRGPVLEGLAVYGGYAALTLVFLEAVRRTGHGFFYDVLFNGLGPDRHAAADFLRDGFLPLWTRDLYGGVPFVANLQHAVYYPGNLPFLVLPVSTALDVVVATTIAFAAFAMWAYCRFALGTSRWAAWLGGLAFGFSGICLQHIILTNQLQVIAWMPLVLLFAHLALERGRMRWVVATGLAVGMQFLAGHPEEWVYTLGALALYGLAWSLAGGLRSWPRRAIAAAVRLGGAVALFVALFGWQLFPTLVLRGQGFRNSPSFRDQFPLPERISVNALLPDYGNVLIGENVAFVGVAALLLAGLGVGARRAGPGWIRAWLVALVLIGFVMALGRETAVYRFLYDHVSVVRGFRVPARYLMLTTFAFAAAAALGLDVLLRQAAAERRERLLQAARGLGVVAALFAFALAIGGVTNPHESWERWALAAAAAGAAWFGAGRPAVPRAAVALLLIVATGLELHRARPHAEYRQAAPSEILNWYGPVIERMVEEGGRFVTIAKRPEEGAPAGAPYPLPEHIRGQDAAYFRSGFAYRVIARPNTHVGRHAETVIGRDAGLMPLARYKEFFENASGSGGRVQTGVHHEPPSRWNWDTLDFLAVRWFVTNDLPPSEARVMAAHGFERVEVYDFGVLWRRAAPPLLRVAEGVDVVPEGGARLGWLRAGYPLTRRAMVEEPLDVGPGGRGTVSDVRVLNTRVEARVAAAAPALVVLADPWYPQWRVYVDGERADLVRVNHAFRGVRVPAGEHRIEFRYTDRAHRWGVALALLTAAGLVAFPFARTRLRSRA